MTGQTVTVRRLHDRKSVCACSSALCQIVCVPRDWRVTLVLIVLGNTAVSFMLEVSFAAVTLVSE